MQKLIWIEGRFFSPKVIEKTAKEHLDDLLYYLSIAQLPHAFLDPDHFEQTIETKRIDIIESRELDCEVAPKFLIDLTDPSNPFHTLFIDFSIYDTIVMYLNRQTPY